MALVKVGIEDRTGRQSAVFALAPDEMDPEAVGRWVARTCSLTATFAREVPEDEWYTTDREGIMVTQEEGDVEYPEPILRDVIFEADGPIVVFGSESAESLIEDAEADRARQQVLDEADRDESTDADRLIIRAALEGELERLLYLKGKSHSRLASAALREQYDRVAAVLGRLEQQ